MFCFCVVSGDIVRSMAFSSLVVNVNIYSVVMPILEKVVSVGLPSCEEAFRCSRRSQPNTFSLLPTFLRTLLISSCPFDPTR